MKAVKHSRGKRKSRMEAYNLRREDFRLNSKLNTHVYLSSFLSANAMTINVPKKKKERKRHKSTRIKKKRSSKSRRKMLTKLWKSKRKQQKVTSSAAERVES